MKHSRAYHCLEKAQHRWHELNRRQRGCCRIAGIGIGFLLCIRALPYLAPIRSEALRQDDRAIEFSDRHNLPLGTLLTRDQNHTATVPLAEVSPHFVRAILAAEDRRFFQHGPLDLQAVLRAIAEAVQARRIVSGASTITMQLARIVDPTPSTPTGKLQEIWTAWRLGAGMNRREILQAYINRLPMGGNIYGVEAAARVYFGISARDLNLAQASLLAALPNDPNRLNPYDRMPALKRRQRYVLEQMIRDRAITSAQAQQASAESVALQPRQQGILAAPHFLFWVSQQLPNERPAQIRTTLDRSLQQFIEAQTQQIVRTLAPHNVRQAAALAIENKTGEVLAYVGSTDYFSSATQGRNDGVQALRQPGSTLKPFLYQLALEQKQIRPNTILADVPIAYAIPGARLYRPVDYNEQFQGPVRVRIALANSLNVPAVKLLETVGVPNFLTYLRQLGFEHLTHPPEYYGLGLTLGSGEVTLWELARAYLTLANQGNPLDLKVIPAIPKNGAVAPVSTSQSSLEPNAASWALVTDMLSDRFARARAFGVDSLLSLPFPSAVKTGTSSDFRDTWTVGYTADYTVATWVGNFDGEAMQNVSGVTGAAPLWNRIMLHLHERREPKAFPVPSGLVERPICAISGKKPTPACPTVVREYFYPEDLAAYQRQPDDFFKAIAPSSPSKPPQYRLDLPPEYDEWLASKPEAKLASSTLRILSPRNGDYFLTQDPTQGKQPERLEFKLSRTDGQPIEWRLNGKPLSTASTASLFWPMQPGKWRLEVKSRQLTDRVDFEVQVAQPSPLRQGFSVRMP
ncbi:penicillin-binding protein 1C [Altericista sp. CCNU0014]|uniref:penicillin-binding protein 1C n=1 Tax=Altericista sp. CCNU0014 TaxID=3082949 RepID=UPI0038514D7D